MLNCFRGLAAILLLGLAGPALAADYILPPQETPLPVAPAPAQISGWYLRGDIDFHWSKLRGTEYITYGCCGVSEPGTDDFDTTKLKGAWSVGGGIGYQLARHLRTDLTLDYWSRSKFTGTTSGECNNVPCSSTDQSSYSAWVLLANLYADLGTWQGFTPYVGAGIGGAHVKWADLRNTIDTNTYRHEGGKGWRFAWALMAGTSYCLTDRAEIDAGYRFTRIDGGRMFEFASGVGPGFESGFNVHEVRAGLRWHLGGSSPRCAPAMVSYAPGPQPVYK